MSAGAQSLNPGNEQAEYWGSESAKREGSQNYAGISDPGIDALIRRIIFAKDRDELIATTKALDRVLLAHHYVVPSYTGALFAARLLAQPRASARSSRNTPSASRRSGGRRQPRAQ